MKKKLFALFLIIFSFLSLASCRNSITNIITKDSEEIEVTKISSSITQVYEKVSKGCVGLMVSDGTKAAIGSGVIYKYDSDTEAYYVVTNAHVVEDMTSVKIYFGNSKYNSAEVVGYDSKNDIGVVRFTLDIINTEFKKTIYINDFMNYTENDLVVVGQSVLAIGCPLSLDNFNSLTTGVISSVSETEMYTDALLNPGNSGGGLFNLEGRLIGINNEKTVWTTVTNEGSTETIPVEGRSRSIPLRIVKNCVSNIESTGGNIVRPLLGITVTTVNKVLNPESIYNVYLPVSDDQVFFIVTDFNQNGESFGKKYGIMLYDVILEVNDKKVVSAATISLELSLITKNDSIKLKVYRIENGIGTTKEIIVSFK